jgi:hypothetical protein
VPVIRESTSVQVVARQGSRHVRRDERKKQKKRLKDRKKAADRRGALAAWQRANLYPQIILDPTAGDPEFVSIVERIVAEFDFEDPAICSPAKQGIYQVFHKVGLAAMLNRMGAAVEAGAKQGFTKEEMEDGVLYPLLLYLGNWIFERLPEPCRMTPLPFHYFFVEPYTKDLVIRFAFLPDITSEHGRIYYSPLEPTVPFGGGNWKVGFFRHAIERICERICPSPQIGYAHFSSCAMWFRDCIYYEPLELPDGQHAIRLFEYCNQGGDMADHPYVKHVLDQQGAASSDGTLGHVLGYCPVSFIGPRAVAKTFLYPGYRNTPEDHLVRTAPISMAKRRELLALASDNNANRVYRAGGLEAIKWYHQNGVPQVFLMKRELSYLRKSTPH